eukprot:TRINITY_DN6116_c0_g1_i4.p1 TRINITY_DN6116_c0_g1~~TRINITY_DN6116_c0_g1_i4.p1  ORF type:complete len:470 (+),score=126.40 TRINITY_DN6116_c0_g1_i4:221-1630(+)
MRRPRADSFGDTLLRYRGVILVVSVPLVLIAIVFALMPRSVPVGTGTLDDPLDRSQFDRSEAAAAGGAERYAVVIDCGSTGSRVHVYKFSSSLELLEIEGELELFISIKPGLSFYKDEPQKGGDSLRQLLDKSVAAVPEPLRVTTPVFVGATAGLRLLPGDLADQLLNEVRKVLESYPFKFQANSVKILDGSDEGSFAWVTVNYLLGNLGKDISNTVGVVDLGGGSVQMTYAVPDDVAKTAPTGYIRALSAMGQKYNIYVYSYLGYGLMAARAKILKEKGEGGHPCIVKGFEGKYKYGGEEHEVLSKEGGTDYGSCKQVTESLLTVAETPCHFDACSFGGIWSGGGGAGATKLYVASYFFDRAGEFGIIPDPKAASADVKASLFADAAEKACSAPIAEIPKLFPGVEEKDAGYGCLDLSYQYSLLTLGFSIHPSSTITLVKQIRYKGKDVEAAWPLGAAIDAMSSLPSS